MNHPEQFQPGPAAQGLLQVPPSAQRVDDKLNGLTGWKVDTANLAAKTKDDLHVALILAEDKQRAEQILAEILHGMAFSDAAKKYSAGPNPHLGGDIGFINPNDMGESVRKALAKLAPSQISGIVESGKTFLILRRLE